jgi:hypothetical protein
MMNIIGARLSPDTRASNETRDIYLPNQTEQVSQIAIDVSVYILNKEPNPESANFCLSLTKLGNRTDTPTSFRLEAH